MKTVKMMVVTFAMILTAASAFAADTRGRLVDVNSNGSVIVKTAVLGLSGAEEKNMRFDAANDAVYMICLSGQCAEKRGAEGVRLFEEYAAFAAYGLSPVGSSITLHREGSLVKRIQANL